MGLLTKQEPTTKTSLEAAFNHLLSSFDKEELRQPLDPELEWEAIESHDPDIQVLEYGDIGTWPSTNNAIIRFKEYPHHYAKVHNFLEHEILDSDGKAKKAYIYGIPQGWARYAHSLDVVSSPAPDERVYTLKERETLWSVARDRKLDAEELAEHNGIEKAAMFDVSEGYTLHLPIAKKAPPEPTTGYKVLETPRIAHVSKEGGAKKYSFGNVRKIEQITETGPTYKQGHSVTIVAEAHVPVVDNGEHKILRFDMDSNAYNVADNKVIHTIGYNWTHLTDGIYPPSEQPVQNPPEEEEEQEESKAEEKPDIVVEKPKLPWKEQFALTYNGFSEGALWFTAKEDMLVRDMATVRQPRKLLKGQDVLLAGTFRIDGKLYGNPQTGADAGLAWAVPMHKVVEKIEEREDEKELYNTSGKPLKLNYKFNIKSGRLTVEERLVALPLSQTANLTNKAVKFVKQIKIRSK